MDKVRCPLIAVISSHLKLCIAVVVYRYRDPQLKVGENLLIIVKFKIGHLQTFLFKHLFQ